MTSSKPYLLRAIYEWLSDNGMTPFLLVNADVAGVQVPRQYVENGRVVLNIAAGAVQGLVIRNDDVSFSARFGGVAMNVSLPMSAAIAIYARENGQGMFFEEDAPPEPPSPVPPVDDKATNGQRPSLRRVK